ncbi:MAG: hypothetical protein GY758_10225, partial [Fuerstiella sp.]|nr:hypothetical protein [Fuerstiella sp.]
MKIYRPSYCVQVAAVALTLAVTAMCPAQNQPAATSKITFSRMSAARIKAELLPWLKSTGADPSVVERESANWSDADRVAAFSGEELLDELV